jgi:hypothetical protein
VAGKLKIQYGKAAIIHTSKDLTPNDKRRGGARPKAGLEIAVSNELTTATSGRVLRELRLKENINLKLKTKGTGSN